MPGTRFPGTASLRDASHFTLELLGKLLVTRASKPESRNHTAAAPEQCLNILVKHSPRYAGGRNGCLQWRRPAGTSLIQQLRQVQKCKSEHFVQAMRPSLDLALSRKSALLYCTVHSSPSPSRCQIRLPLPSQKPQRGGATANTPASDHLEGSELAKQLTSWDGKSALRSCSNEIYPVAFAN